MTNDRAALVRRFYDEVWGRGLVEVAGEIFAESYARHDLRPNQAVPGPEGKSAAGPGQASQRPAERLASPA
jgi:hypothetical protein